MNILLTSTLVPSAPSGLRVHYERLAEQLRQQGHTVTLITPDSQRLVIRRSIGAVRRGLKLLMGRFGNQIGIELGYIAEIYFAIDRSIAYDVVNAQDVSSGWAAHLALAGRVPVVVTGHFNDHPAEELVHQQHFGGLTARFLHRWYGFLLRRTHFFIGVSDYVRQRSVPWLAPDAHHTVVYNGVAMNLKVPTTPPAAATNLRQQFPGRPILLNVGQLEARKNQRFLIPVAAELRRQGLDFVLALVGRGEDEALLQQLIKEADLTNHVFLLGYHRDVMALLRTADVYVHTALRENCPLVLIEAMAARCPAVALAVGGIPELLAPTPEALISPTAAPDVLAQGLADLLKSTERRAQLQQTQLTFAATHFDSSVMLADTLAFFHEARQILGLPALAAPTVAPAPPTYAYALSAEEHH
ncbi:glycosyltransferase family 4 protein [Hymenobacter sp.]|jgi:glycosyltransferase involved in cell wall biosynthesis|uniref:glycosyltransferase family 4 protein n=1 Tax=Hymenobacter sp. TaxID=1898978 RepID=UPI002EDA098A